MRSSSPGRSTFSHGLQKRFQKGVQTRLQHCLQMPTLPAACSRLCISIARKSQNNLHARAVHCFYELRRSMVALPGERPEPISTTERTLPFLTWRT